MEEEQQDRISNLPDSIIHHILSYLPSTREAIQTGILSKRWHKQWTHVPVLIFDFSHFSDIEAFSSFDIRLHLLMLDPNFSDKGDISTSDVSKIIEDTLSLHVCSNIRNFRLQMLSVISFRKGSYVLPDFLFNNASLLKLRTVDCILMTTEMVNWARLTVLCMERCTLPHQVVLEQILSGSPLLTSLEFSNVHFDLFDKLVVSSKSLKRFVLHLPNFLFETMELEISCPLLEELSLKRMHGRLDRVIQNVLLDCLLLESLELNDWDTFCNLVIASKSLRRLVLSDLIKCSAIEISCPNLEKLDLSGCLNVRSAKLPNLQSSLCATIDFYQNKKLDHYGFVGDDESRENKQSLVKDILKQLKDVQQLKIGGWFIEVLSAIEVGGLFSTELNINCLILCYWASDDCNSGFASLLRNSNMIEKLVIDLPLHFENYDGDLGEDYWNSNEIAFDCLASHLKIVKIIGFLERDKRKIINFVRFFLKNASVLEKLVVISKDRRTNFLSEASEELLNMPRCSQKAIVELLSSK